MTREEIYSQCVQKIAKTNCLLLEAATGTGKTKVSIDLTNYLINSKWFKDKKIINVLILVAKRVHKQTWKEEIAKWGGFHHPTAKINVCMECYESLKNHCKEHWDLIIADEVHHIGSEARLEFFRTMTFGYFIGLSATINRKLKSYFKFCHHSEVVSCDIIEAIEDEILPEPEILMFPLQLDSVNLSEEWEINPKAKGPVVYGQYKDMWKYKRQGVHAILSCTQKQKSIEFNALALYWKNRFNMTRNEAVKQLWLRTCGSRLEYYADIKLPIIKDILKKLQKYRTITFCKTIPQAEAVGKWCIHSKNGKSDEYYQKFNERKINHITAVNILNENANLVDCKYAIFTNFSSSEIVSCQRIGRSLRHKSPVIILPYYTGTREEEIAKKMVEDFNKDFIRVIHSIQEI